MEIDTRQIDALRIQQEQGAAGQVQRKPDTSFNDVLLDELGALDGANSASLPLPPGGPHASLISELLLNGVGETTPAMPEEAVMQAAFANASGALDMWDAYARAVDSGQEGSLREAFGLLEGIDRQVAGIRESTAGLRGTNPGLDGLLNELEVLSATEHVKFNRGDYLL